MGILTKDMKLAMRCLLLSMRRSTRVELHFVRRGSAPPTLHELPVTMNGALPGLVVDRLLAAGNESEQSPGGRSATCWLLLPTDAGVCPRTQLALAWDEGRAPGAVGRRRPHSPEVSGRVARRNVDWSHSSKAGVSPGVAGDDSFCLVGSFTMLRASRPLTQLSCHRRVRAPDREL